jgi:CheY-like chemotaxis protein
LGGSLLLGRVNDAHSLPSSWAGEDSQMNSAQRTSANARLRILIVDDNVDAAEILAELLDHAGHSVFTAHDGKQGLALFDSIEPDVAILDLGLPSIDGFQLARFVRTDARFQTTTLIAHSCYNADGDRERTKAAGFDHHVSKFDIDTLKELLATYTK